MIASILSYSANSQPQDRNSEVEKLFDYYRTILPQSYIRRVKGLKIEGIGSRRLEEFENLLEEENNPSDMVSCLKKNYQSISLTELQILFEHTEKYFSDHSKLIDCEAKKTVINEAELNEIYSDLSSNKLFNNSFPAGNCFDRAYLISKKLDSKGIGSSQILINDDVVAAYKTENGYKAESYPVHIANMVKVEINGKVVEYVIDPIYLDSPLTLDEYKNKVLVNVSSPYVSVVPQSHFYEKKQTDDECSYNEFELEVAKQNILRSLDNKPKNQCTDGNCFENRDLAIQNFKEKYFKK